MIYFIRIMAAPKGGRLPVREGELWQPDEDTQAAKDAKVAEIRAARGDDVLVTFHELEDDDA